MSIERERARSGVSVSCVYSCVAEDVWLRVR